MASAASPKKVVVLYKRNAEPDTELVHLLEQALSPPEFDLFIDRHLKIGVEWARTIEEKIRNADYIIALLSDSALSSEMIEYEIEIALDQMLRTKSPVLLPIRVASELPAKGTIGVLLNNLQYSTWQGKDDNSNVLAELVDATLVKPTSATEQFSGSPIGTVPAESPMYIRRNTDADLEQAIGEKESIILIKGARQVGKTSLIGQGIRTQRRLGGRFVTSDFQQLASVHLKDADTCYRILAANMAQQLRFGYDFESEWLAMYGPGSNFHRFLRALVMSDPTRIVWFMDEVDRLFSVPFSTDFFGLVRSWHNVQSMEPDLDWSRLSIVITYATEAHLFIQDLNQSPFNVGQHLHLHNFSFEQVQELNERYGKPFRNIDQLQWLYHLIEGQPFLTRQAMDFVVRAGGDLRRLTQLASADDGPFGDHLKRILVSVSQLDGVMSAMRASLSNVVLRDSHDVQRLLAAGILVRRPEGQYGLACDLYRQYLARHLVRLAE